ncbi:mannitol dehydrogenase family protein [Anaerosinus massiliensis]|uniref:mannitol dehydrogenase family protein n=1 Tax=Massilibacillus massiliensis TaxID=1806837 RepID=UPI001F255C93|nr:mannitol dehydrogenase [Massilibacillus massiliensis]
MGMKKAVVIGAGQAGRGYIGRLLAEIGYEIIFIEKKQALVDLLCTDGHFSVHFYDKDRTPVIVEDYKALQLEDAEVDRVIKEADFIFTATGEQNLPEVAKRIQKSLAERLSPVVMITCENGINPGKRLAEALEAAGGFDKSKIFISQTAEFCSTVNLVRTRLDILSQNENFFPYDADGYAGQLEIRGAEPVHEFEKFLKRKIYTYNCLAGLISYCGYVKGYQVYGEAANDEEISWLMDVLLQELNPALAKYFDISEQEQVEFSQKALDKFKNKNILDYILKNGRAPRRKLGPTERIFAPLRIIEANQGDYDILCFNAAAALCYWEEQAMQGAEPAMEQPTNKILCEILHVAEDDAVIKKVNFYLECIHQNRAAISIRAILNEKLKL